MEKERVNAFVRVKGTDRCTDKWSFYKRADGTYAVDIYFDRDFSGIYSLNVVKYRFKEDKKWKSISGKILHVKSLLRYKDTGLRVYNNKPCARLIGDDKVTDEWKIQNEDREIKLVYRDHEVNATYKQVEIFFKERWITIEQFRSELLQYVK